jgi:uncharacterized protein YheU (UPF0270 family)
MSGSERRDHEDARPVTLAPDQLSPEALRGLVEEFVTRDGTDYGAVERTLEEKAARLETQLGSGEAVVVFDPRTETVTIVLARELAGDAGTGRGTRQG